MNASSGAAFEAYSPAHLAALAVVASLIVLFVALGRRWRDVAAARRLEVGVAVAIVALRVGVYAWNLVPPRLSLARSLPLQICDLAALACAWALVTRHRRAQAIAYFWGLALSIQGLLQPDLAAGPASLAFWLFWLHHALIVGAAVYVVAVHCFRPALRDLRLAVVAAVGYVVPVFLLDLLLDVNYGYLGRGTPSQPTLIDVLGPWPWRVPVMVILGILTMALLWLPWARPGRRAR